MADFGPNGDEAASRSWEAFRGENMEAMMVFMVTFQRSLYGDAGFVFGFSGLHEITNVIAAPRSVNGIVCDRDVGNSSAYSEANMFSPPAFVLPLTTR